MSADSNGIAIGGDVVQSCVGSCTLTPDQLAALVRDRANEQTQELKQNSLLLQKALDLNEHQMRTALGILGRSDVPPEELGEQLIDFAHTLKSLQEVGMVQPGDDPDISSLKGRVADALERGDLTAADAALAELQRYNDRLDKQLHASRADTLYQRAKVAMLGRRYADAIEYSKQASALVEQSDKAKWTTYKTVEFTGMFWSGLIHAPSLPRDLKSFTAHPDEAQLKSAAALGEQILMEGTGYDERMLRGNIGVALLISSQGDDATADADLEKSIEYIRSSLDSTPLGASGKGGPTRGNLAEALFTLGQKRNDISLVQASVDEYRTYLSAVRSHTESIDFSFGSALWKLGLLKKDTSPIKEAQAQFRKAAADCILPSEFTEWIQVESDLAAALRETGEMSKSPEDLKSSIEIIQDVLAKGPPLDKKGYLDLNRALALLSLNALLPEEADLQDAVDSFTAATTEQSDIYPDLQYRAKVGLGETLLRIAQTSNDRAALRKAVDAFHTAFLNPNETADEVLSDRKEFIIALASFTLKNPDYDHLTIALDEMQSFETVAVSRFSPTEAAAFEHVLGRMRMLRGQLTNDIKDYSEAISKFEHARAIYIKRHMDDDVSDENKAIATAKTGMSENAKANRLKHSRQ